MPVPVSDVACGLLFALSVTLIVPVRVPVAAGLNFTEILQLLPAAKVLGDKGQEFVGEKSPLG